ncbi:Uncharacterised protein [Burkholderia pseudomallei]|nr:Uncharacterised protein [Burkholderia pseudomallei]
MSSGCPTRRAGSRAAADAYIASRAASSSFDHSGVATSPGDTVFTRTGASSSASPRASASSAALIAPCSTALALGRTLRKPETNVSDPPGAMRAARATRYAPQNLLSIAACASASGSLRTGPPGVCAADMTTWSNGPASAKKASTAGASVVSSTACRTGRGPSIARAAPASLFASRDAIVTSASSTANARAAAAPIPELPPMTRTR